MAATTTSAQVSLATFSGLRATTRVAAARTVSVAPLRRRLSISAAASADTVAKVSGIIAKQLAVAPEKITAESKFVDLGADSLDTVEIMMALEETFELTLDEEAAAKISTVQDAADLIESQVSAKA